MGEYDQPVVGMKSVFDYSEDEGYKKETWSAREWFLVRKAEVHLSEDGVLLPMVKMAVEAREQVFSNGQMIDAPITRNDHPMVKYAESFTKNFDLIAERKSVVYHLRELAKASVLAKFLVDSHMKVEESWFNLAGEMEEACALEIPQLWNERVHSQIRVRDGEILDSKLGCQMRGIYGGVQFGLDKFKVDQLQPRKSMMPPASASLGATGLGGVARRGLLAGGVLARSGIPGSVSQAPLSGALQAMSTAPRMAVPIMQASMAAPSLAGPLAAGMANLAMPTPPRVSQPLGLSSLSAGIGTNIPLAGGSTIGHPRGVDLNLNQFSLDTVEQMAEGNWVCEPQSEAAVAAMSDSFWSCIDGGKASPFETEDLTLLKKVFNPNLSDRRAEGEVFAPPDTSIASINKLRTLVKEEEEVRQKRKDNFCSTSFRFDNPGPLFPTSWTPSLEVAGTKTSEHVLAEARSLQARTDYKSEAEEVLKSAAPAFCKKTEDGTSFRIYRVGSLEVRSTQEYDGEEAVGAVFSVRGKADPKGNLGAARCAGGREKIQRVTEYVQKVARSGAAVDSTYFADYRYYTVLETETGITILTEQLKEGVVTWEENVADLEDRNSLAKVIRSANCQAGVAVQDLRVHRVQVLQNCQWSLKHGQSYATSAFTMALGGMHEVLQAAQNRERDIKLREADVKERD